ncbi:MAG: STAS domain-containing protein [Acidobacteriota bacterium]
MDTRDFDGRDKKTVMSISFREKNNVLIADLVGEVRLTEDFTPSLRNLISEHIAGGKINFLLNFAKVDFVDSYGIGDIVAAYLDVQGKSGKLKMTNLSPKIRLIFNYSGLTRVLEIFDNEEKALASFA